jgi:hypothetical protein
MPARIAGMAKLFRWATVSAVVLAVLSMAATALAATGWNVDSAPHSAPNTNAIINSAFARADSDVWAVGTTFGTAGSSPSPPIAYHWNGSVWSLISTPTLSAGAGLLGVSASTATDAWAVGFLQLGSYRNSQSLFEHWNGTAWSVVGGANVGRLAGVADLSSTNAWAVSTLGVIEHWDGAAWTAVSTAQPNPANTVGNRVSSISADSASDIWIAGTYTTPDYTTAAYALHYNGSAWSVVPMAQPASSSVSIGAVTSLSPSNAWAVGQTGTDPLIEHWNGSQWSIQATPSGVQYPSLTAVAARSATDVWAFGTRLNDNFTAQIPLMLHFDGKTWSRADSPTGNATYSALNTAATTPGGPHVWAFGVGANNQPLILSHS